MSRQAALCVLLLALLPALARSEEKKDHDCGGKYTAKSLIVKPLVGNNALVVEGFMHNGGEKRKAYFRFVAYDRFGDVQSEGNFHIANLEAGETREFRVYMENAGSAIPDSFTLEFDPDFEDTPKLPPRP